MSRRELGDVNFFDDDEDPIVKQVKCIHHKSKYFCPTCNPEILCKHENGNRWARNCPTCRQEKALAREQKQPLLYRNKPTCSHNKRTDYCKQCCALGSLCSHGKIWARNCTMGKMERASAAASAAQSAP